MTLGDNNTGDMTCRVLTTPAFSSLLNLVCVNFTNQVVCLDGWSACERPRQVDRVCMCTCVMWAMMVLWDSQGRC